MRDLRDHPDLLQDVELAGEDPPLSAIARWRDGHSRELVSAALEVSAVRRRARSKFGPVGFRLFADREGLEQASSGEVARYKARRFLLAGASTVMDLCCGIGGDALGFRQEGLSVVGLDRSRGRAWMCRENVGCRVVVGDAGRPPFAAPFWHLDPARRNAAGRVWRWRDHEPGPEAWAALRRAGVGGAVKLGPGIEPSDDFPLEELEMVGVGGRLVQAIAWVGTLATASRRATRIVGQDIQTVSRPAGSLPATCPAGELGEVLLVPDPAVERAGLLGEICREVGAVAFATEGLGLLTTREPPASGWVTSYRVLARLPWQERTVRRQLRLLGSGIVEVRTRGRATPDAEGLAKRLRGTGDRALTLFVLRLGRERTAIVTERCALSSDSDGEPNP